MSSKRCLIFFENRYLARRNSHSLLKSHSMFSRWSPRRRWGGFSQLMFFIYTSKSSPLCDPNCRLKTDMNTHSKVVSRAAESSKSFRKWKEKEITRHLVLSSERSWMLNTWLPVPISCPFLAAANSCAKFTRRKRSRIWNKRAMTRRDNGKLGKTFFGVIVSFNMETIFRPLESRLAPLCR